MLVSWTIGTNILRVTNLQRSMSRNSMNFSLDVVPSIRKVKLKFFLDSESALEMIYKLNWWLGVTELEAAYLSPRFRFC